MLLVDVENAQALQVIELCAQGAGSLLAAFRQTYQVGCPWR